MTDITADLVKRGYPPITEVMSHYDNKLDFIQDLESYIRTGVIISTPKFFIMGKPVDSKVDPRKRAMVCGVKPLADACLPIERQGNYRLQNLRLANKRVVGAMSYFKT